MIAIHERYARAESRLAWNALAGVYAWRVQPRWLGPDDERFWYRVRTRRGHEFMLVDPEARERRPAFNQERLAAALATALDRPVEPYDLPFREITFLDGNIGFSVAEQAWRCSLADYALARGGPPAPPHELLAPDGRHAVFVQDHNLWLREVASDERVQLTNDGEPDYGYGEEPGGTMSSVTEAIQGVRHPPAALWSPDSRRLLVFRVDDRAPRLMHLLQHVPTDGSIRPVLHSYRQPLAEDEHERRYGTYAVVDVAERRVVPVALEREADIYASPAYLTQLGLGIADYWSPDGRLFIHTSRGREGVELYEVNPTSGAARLILEERADTPVYLNPFFGAKPNYRVLTGSDELIWFSERDGWAHLYLYELSTGRLKRQLTAGAWAVRDVLHVDEARRELRFTAGGREPERSPYRRGLYRVGLDGGEPELLAPEDAEHLVTVAPSGRYAVDSFGRIDMPPSTVLRDADGQVLLALEQADADDLLATGFRFPTPFRVQGRDGATAIYGALFLPSHFDPARRYPLVDAIYGGPQVTVVPEFFPVSSGAPYPMGVEVPADDYWDPQAVAELGFAVMVVDGMGTPYRSRAFHDVATHDPANGGGLEDHVAAIRQLAAAHPFIDGERVGIYGHSAGGDNACKALLLFPDVYKVGVASAGSHEMRGYPTISYHATQQGEGAAAQRVQANAAYAHRLAGRLLLVTGDMDENVHPLHTYRVVDALIAANKDFDLLVLPNRNHGLSGDPYFIRRKWDYLVRHLLNETPPSYRIEARSMAELT